MATATALRIGPADHGRAMTCDEFRAAEVKEGYRCELAGGIVEVTEIPDGLHRRIVSSLRTGLIDHGRANPDQIRRAGGAGEFRLWLPGMVSSRCPDVAVVLRWMPRAPEGKRPPSLVMEVVSEGLEAHERDYVAKRREYLAFGLLEFWIIDPIGRRVTVLVRDGDVWEERVFVGDQAAEGLVLPGFTVRPDDLWREAEA